MGLVLKSTGSDFEANATSYLPPVSAGLVYWGFPNDTKAKVATNFAIGGTAGIVVGSPTINSKGVVLDNSNYIQTAVVQTPSLTFIVVGNPVVDGAEQGMFISNYTGPRPSGLAGTSFGASLYCSADDAGDSKFKIMANVSMFNGTGAGTSTIRQATLNNIDITKPAFLAMTFDSTEKIVRAVNMSTGLSTATVAATDSIDLCTTPFRIGASPLASYPNKARNLHFVAIYDRKLSDTELRLVYARVKIYLEKRGVTV